MGKILFLVDNLAILPNILVYRYSVRSANCSLIIDRFMVETRGLEKVINKMVEKNIFSSVYFFDFFPDQNKKIDEKDYELYIKDFYGEQLEIQSINLNSYDKIITSYDTWCGFVTLYLNMIGQPYFLLQTHSEQWQEMAIPHAGWRPGKVFLSLMRKYRAWSMLAEGVVPILCEGCSDEIKQKVEKYEIWDKQEIIDNISNEDICDIAECYGVTEVSQNSTLLLCNSYGFTMNIGVFSDSREKLGLGFCSPAEIFAEYHLIALDYYTHLEDVYIKPHPNDPIKVKEIDDYYHNKVKIFTEMPTEFIYRYMEIKDIHFERVLGFFSNALSISSDCKMLTLGQSYARTWVFYDSLYVLSEVSKFTGEKMAADIDCSEQLKFLGIGERICEHFNYEKKELSKYNDCLLCVDCIKLRNRNISIDDICNWVSERCTVAFLNADLVNMDLPFEKDKMFFVIRITKDEVENDFPNIRNETIYYFCKDRVRAGAISGFKMRRDMNRRGFLLNAFALNNIKKVDWLFAKRADYCANNVDRLNKEVTKTKNQLNLMIRLKVNKGKKEYFRKTLLSVNDMECFLECLLSLPDDYALLLGVRDTPGNNMPDFVMDLIHMLGFTNFDNQLWRMYAGVKYKEKIIYDYANPIIGESVLYESNSFSGLNMNIKIESMPFKNGNKCSIIVNGKDYSVNMRGINIVIYDVINNEVVDSIGCDCHGNNIIFERK